VTLDSIVYRWLEGLSPETIAECFPVLKLEQVYGAVTYYLGHRAEIDAYLKAADDEYEAFRVRVRTNCPRLSQRLDHLLHPAEA
jgi:glycine/D-amino acid oxidase-like deaminating enzyme